MNRFVRMAASTLMLFGLQASLFGASLLVEAESFGNKGGWKVDQQFMDLMGSPYLIAHGLGTPVADAVTQATFPAKGEYHVYVRTYNWTSPWHEGEGPGRFCLTVGGRRLPAKLGASGKQWLWQDAGKVKVSNLVQEIALRDLTGFDGRCDAIYFTTDATDMPPTELSELSSWRRAKHGLPDVAPIAGTYNLVVVGAGIAGMSAAASAARLGCSVALINDRPVIGGNNSSEIRVHLGGVIETGEYPALGTLQNEFGPTRGGNAQPAEVYEDQKKLDWIRAESGIELFADYRVVRVEMDGQKIVSVTAQHIADGNELRFVAPLFADCTGDGTVGFLAGADYRMGREAKDEFGESIAPDVADKMTMGASVQWYSEDAGKKQPFPDFSYGLAFDEKNCERVTMGEWTWETGMNHDQIHDFERIRDYGMLVVYSNWSFLKNRLADNAQYANRRLAWVAYIAGKRESRRLMGDYILHQDDITKHVAHEDASFATTWSIDLHRPDPANSASFPGMEFKAVTTHIPIYPYGVPYRCLYSRNVDNLFMAGRNISQTHVALGTTRVMRTTGMMGEVVGMAAAICREHGVCPRDVYRHHLPQLKKLMAEGVGRRGIENNQKYNLPGQLNAKPVVK